MLFSSPGVYAWGQMPILLSAFIRRLFILFGSATTEKPMNGPSLKQSLLPRRERLG